MSKSSPYFVLVNKPVGMGSTDVVRHFKIHLPKPMDKIGHIGTLDPFAEGLLIIGVNGAQKANDLIHENCPKTYLATGVLGIKTSTGDHTGEVLIEDSIDHSRFNWSLTELNSIFREKFLGEYLQRPHKVSAVRVKGKRLYEYEREGLEVEILPVKRFIFELDILEIDFPRIVFRAKVSSGTYIRVLFEEMAKCLNLHGHLAQLVREKIGAVDLSRAITKEKWPLNKEWLNNVSHQTTVDSVLPFSKVVLSEKHCALFMNGVRLRKEQIFSADQVQLLGDGECFWATNASGQLLGLFTLKDLEIRHLILF